MKVTVGYTLYQSEQLLPAVISGIENCFDKGDEIIFLLDNCTDKTHEILRNHNFEKFKVEGEEFPRVKFIFPKEELFEIKANNRILKEATNDTIILFQSDMICRDPDIKEKVEFIKKYYGDKLGLVGCRDGFELVSSTFPEQPQRKVSSWSHDNKDTRMLFEDEFTEKTFLNRGPLIFTKKLLDTVGFLNEDYYPQWGDDLDYCARAHYKYGLKNVVLQADIESKLEWGTTRSKETNLYALTRGRHIKKNWSKFVTDWGSHFIR